MYKIQHKTPNDLNIQLDLAKLFETFKTIIQLKKVIPRSDLTGDPTY